METRREAAGRPAASAIDAARAAGANTFHLMFRGADLEDYLSQLDIFAEQVVPLVDEA